MSTVKGVPAHIEKSESDGDYFYEPDAFGQSGVYGMQTGSAQSRRRSDVPCPYCHEPLTEWLGPNARISYVQSQTEAIVEWVPETHCVFGCKHCRQVFTMLREECKKSSHE